MAGDTHDDRLDAGMRAARPRGDAIARQAARANVRGRLFGSAGEPVRLGRFVLLEELGAGGMGVVYSAYDPQLDRRVALKVIRTSCTDSLRRKKATRRLIREAKALAQVSHPNVVPVHDVGTIDDEVFVVMEFVEGQNLRDWAAEDRSWREIRSVYCQAGDGLAAAHELGVIHRDFKPDNAVVDEEGRTRVIDFGLARGPSGRRSDRQNPRARSFSERPELGGRIDEPSTVRLRGADPDPAPRPELLELAGAAQLSSRLTATGAVVGTPAYMAPEQIADEPVGPAADQFSFCASLYQALYGVLPFPGDNLDELFENVAAGRFADRPKGAAVPRWVLTILLRGLQRDPKRRYPSMTSIVTALRRDPGRIRRRWMVASAFGAVSAVAIHASVSAPAERLSAAEWCQNAGQDTAAIWSSERRDAVHEAMLATELPYATSTWDGVAQHLDDYSARLRGMFQEACLANKNGEQSDTMFDRRARCLQRRMGQLDARVAVLREVDATSLENATAVARGLPAIRDCADVGALNTEHGAHENPWVAEEISLVEAQLARATALGDAGRQEEAIPAVAEVVAAAEQLGDWRLLGTSLLAQGTIMMHAIDHRADAAEPLQRAAQVGLEKDAVALSVEAIARYLWVQAYANELPDSALDVLIPLAEAMAQRLPGDSFIRALLANNIGVVYMARGDRDRAGTYLRRAAVNLAGAQDQPAEATIILRNLVMLSSDESERRSLLEHTLAQQMRMHGQEHPWTLETRLVLSHYTTDLDRARSVLEPACELYRDLYAETQMYFLVHCLYHAGFLASEQGRFELAAETFGQAARLEPRAELHDARMRRDLARAYELRFRGQHGVARRHFAQVVDVAESHGYAFLLPHALAGLGASLHDLRRHADAIPVLERAVVELSKLCARNEIVEARARLAHAQIQLASALSSLARTRGSAAARRARARSAELMDRAKSWYVTAGPSYADHVRRLER